MLDVMAVNLLIAAVVLLWILARQLRTRPVRERSRIGIVLLVVGVVQTYSFVSGHRLGVADLSWVSLSLVIGLGLAVLRAFTVRIWQEGGVVLRRGTWVTAVLWLVAIGQHLLIDQFVAPGFSDASLLLYFGVVLTVQQLVLVGRARANGHLGSAPGRAPQAGPRLSGWSSTNSPPGSPRR